MVRRIAIFWHRDRYRSRADRDVRRDRTRGRRADPAARRLTPQAAPGGLSVRCSAWTPCRRSCSASCRASPSSCRSRARRTCASSRRSSAGRIPGRLHGRHPARHDGGDPRLLPRRHRAHPRGLGARPAQPRDPQDARLAPRLVRPRRHDPDRHLRARVPRTRSRSARATCELIGTALIVLGLVLLYAEHVSTRSRGIESLTMRDGILIGVAQACALIPGVSRSGATITGGLFLGLDRTSAARYSFLLSIPAVVLSGLLELRHATEGNGPGAGADDHRDRRSRSSSGYASIAVLLQVPDDALHARVRGLPRRRSACSCSCSRRPGPFPDARDRGRAGRGAGVGHLGRAATTARRA